MRVIFFSMLLLITQPFQASARAAPAVGKLEATEADRKAIHTLLDTYTKAVSSKDQKLFESLLLNLRIPFSHTAAALKNGASETGTQNYEQFRQGVFEGPPFTQRFQDVSIRQDGVLANVTLIFVNTSTQGVGWGWKTLQLLKVEGQWKIASEFFTTH